MKKKTLLIAAGLLAAASSAQALDINIYGASAQFAFLTSIADNILTSTQVGCTSTTGATTIGTQFAITGVGPGSGTKPCATGITMRIANKSSGDGIKAILTGSAAVAPCASGQRQFINPGDTAAPVNTDVTRCFPVTLAASDVAFDTFAETTNGCQYGPVYEANAALGGALSCGPAPTKTCSTASGVNKCYITNKVQNAIAGASLTALTVKNPMVLPFAFWANNTIKVNKCVAADTNAGRLCDPATSTPCAPGNCAAITLDGISRIQAANIFSGTVTDLAAFGTAYTSTSATAGTKIRVCQRHAGSGTQATLNQAVMNGGKWGAALTTDPDGTCNPTTGTWPTCLPTPGAANANGAYTYFNDSADDLMNCVASVDNAIGQADADICNSTAPNQSSIFTGSNAYGYNMCNSVHALNYNGYKPTRENVRNGLYEFWTKENLYQNKVTYPLATSAEGKFFTAMIQAIVPGFLTPATAGQSSDIWATVAEMNFSKTDKVYPSFGGGASSPVAP